MRDFYDILSERFYERHFSSLEVLRIIKDVLNIAGDGGNFTVHTVNQKLENLGWKREILDQFSFELILAFLDSNQGCTVAAHTLH